MSQIANIIAACNFDDNDLDIGTSGLCGTFALALYGVLKEHSVPAQIILICLRNADGSVTRIPATGKDVRSLYWRHVAVMAGERYYDVTGEVQLPDMIDNFCWGHLGDGGIAVPVSVKELTEVLRAKRSSYDARYFLKWKHAITRATRKLETICTSINR